jgi:6-phosphogluconate dehydrogenase
MPASFGLIGLGLMGRNLADNLLGQNQEISVYSYDAGEREAYSKRQGANVEAADSLPSFVATLDSPRIILLMVTAGDVVDQVLADIIPLLDEGDVIIDGGNSFFEDTIRRNATLAELQIGYLGTGISGGAEGARQGASIMAGGSHHAFDLSKNLLGFLAADVEGSACLARTGNDGSGHFVKMVHNGIEYGLMQIIAEVYQFLDQHLNYSAEQTQSLFEKLSKGPLKSYLLEITADIFKVVDDESDDQILLVNLISDRAGQKGTGRWTVDSAMKLGVPIPTISAAVTERQISSMKDLRFQIEALLPEGSLEPPEQHDWPALVEDAMLGAFVATYTQGFQLIFEASKHYGWEVNLAAVARIWRGGCIIRSSLLEKFLITFEQEPNIQNLLTSQTIAPELLETINNWRLLVSSLVESGSSAPALSASLAYVESVRSGRLPTSLIQAQRDYFGAHTYERIDKQGHFHHNWEED